HLAGEIDAADDLTCRGGRTETRSQWPLLHSVLIRMSHDRYVLFDGANVPGWQSAHFVGRSKDALVSGPPRNEEQPVMDGLFFRCISVLITPSSPSPPDTPGSSERCTHHREDGDADMGEFALHPYRWTSIIL